MERSTGSSFSFFWKMVFKIGIFLLVYRSCESPDLAPYSITSTEEVRLAVAAKDIRRYANIPIILTNCQVLSSFYFHSRGFYFVESTDDGCTMLVLTSILPLPENSKIKIFGTITPIYSNGDDFNLVFVKESYSELENMEITNQ